MDPARLLPHAPPMRLITRVVEIAGDRARAVGRIGPTVPGADGRTAPAVLGIELGAQCAALIGAALIGAAVIEAESVASGVEATDTLPDAARVGHLVSIRSATFTTAFLPVDRDLDAVARRVGGAGGLELFEVAIRTDPEGEPTVRATIGTMLAR